MSGTDENEAQRLHDVVYDFDLWSDLHGRHGAINHPSELHGLLAGELAAGERLSSERWENLALEHLGCDRLEEQQADEQGDEQVSPRALLHAFYAATLAALQSEDMDFQLLLPAEQAPLNQRLEALSNWVRGFLEGMARAAGDGLSQAPDDIRELIRDFVAISQVESDADDGEEDGDRDIEELSEYIRVGVLNVFAEFNHPQPDSQPDQQTLH